MRNVDVEDEENIAFLANKAPEQEIKTKNVHKRPKLDLRNRVLMKSMLCSGKRREGNLMKNISEGMGASFRATLESGGPVIPVESAHPNKFHIQSPKTKPVAPQNVCHKKEATPSPDVKAMGINTMFRVLSTEEHHRRVFYTLYPVGSNNNHPIKAEIIGDSPVLGPSQTIRVTKAVNYEDFLMIFKFERI